MKRFISTLALAASLLSVQAQDANYAIVAERDTVIKAQASGITLGARKVRHFLYLYMSKDVQGNDVTLSATMQVPSEVFKGSAPSDGVVLYNHHTHSSTLESPMFVGELPANALLASPLKPNYILVMSDHVGFGFNALNRQAYLCGETNARNSLDALLAAQHILKDKGIEQGKYLFNIGYSQGGTDAMFVAKLRDMEYKDKGISFDKTFCGSGVLDVDKCYTEVLGRQRTDNPATVAMLLVSYNENFQMGFDYHDMFLEPLASKVDDWILEKDLTAEQLNDSIGSDSLKHFLHPNFLNLESDALKAMRQKFSETSLTKDWTPDPNQRFFILHSRHDSVVPVQASRNIFSWLKKQGFKPSIVPGKTSLQTNTALIKTSHTTSGLVWFVQTAAALQLWPVLYYEGEQNRYYRDAVAGLNVMSIIKLLESKGIDLRRIVRESMSQGEEQQETSIFDMLNKITDYLKKADLTLSDFYEIIEDAGITQGDLMQVLTYLIQEPEQPATNEPAAQDEGMEMASATQLLTSYEQMLASWLLQAGLDAHYEAWGKK